MRSKRREMKKVAPAHNRYLDLDRALDIDRHDMHIIIGMFGPDRVTETVKADATACLSDALKVLRTPRDARERLALWRAIREYLRVAGEATISDVQEFLVWISFPNFTRQALESALQNHDDIFKVTKRGKERYIELQ